MYGFVFGNTHVVVVVCLWSFVFWNTATKHTLEERVALIVDAVCRYGKRSDVKTFQDSILKKPTVQRILNNNAKEIQSAFKDCVAMDDSGGSGKSPHKNPTTKSPTKNSTGKSTSPRRKSPHKSPAKHTGTSPSPRRSSALLQHTTTFRCFEKWLTVKLKRFKLSKKIAREIFNHVQRVDWQDGPMAGSDIDMSYEEFEEALVAVALVVDPSPFRALDQRVENGIEQLLDLVEA